MKDNSGGKISKIHYEKKWSHEQIFESTKDHLVYSWGATDTMRDHSVPIERGEGVFLYDFDGKRYYDMTS